MLTLRRVLQSAGQLLYFASTPGERPLQSTPPVRNRRVEIALLLIALSTPCAAHAFQVFKVDPFCPVPGAYGTIQDAVDAAAAYSDADHADYVWIADNDTINGYNNQHVVINDPEEVIIEGGFFDCGDFDPGTDQTRVRGANDGGPVFEITGNRHVYFGNLSISGAQRGAGTKGGGISFVGQGTLTLANTIVINNQAETGGGVYMEYVNKGVKSNLTLTLLANTQIVYNDAVDGGGIALVGSAPGFTSDYDELEADAADTWIAYNQASGLGGGLLVKWLGSAKIGSAGYGDLGILYNNSAARGGAIAVINPANYDAADGPAVSLYTTDAAHPVRIRNNTASEFGGAVYLAASTGAIVENPTNFSAKDFRIDENIAADGSAIYAEPDGGFVAINLNSVGGVQPTNACASGVTCNVIDHNNALNDSGPTDGATITFQDSSMLNIVRVGLRSNTGGNVVHTVGSGGAGMQVDIHDALFADNTTSSDLLKFAGPASSFLGLTNVTIANNAIASPNVIYAEHALGIDASIVDQPGRTAVGYAGAANGLVISDSIASEPAAVNQGFVQGVPVFTDAAAGDYHLLPWSPGVDFAYFLQYVAYDLDGNDRQKDLASVPNSHPGNYYRDAGAYELQFVCAADELFCSGFDH